MTTDEATRAQNDAIIRKALAARRHFIREQDHKAFSCYVGQASTATMYLDMGFTEVDRKTYLAFRRTHKPAGELHVQFNAAQNTAIAKQAKRHGITAAEYVRAVVVGYMRNEGEPV